MFSWQEQYLTCSLRLTREILFLPLEHRNSFFFPELQALAELLGAYGMKHLGQKMMQQIASQVGEIKVLEHIFLAILKVKVHVDDVSRRSHWLYHR